MALEVKKLHFKKRGSGKRALLTFHGFGQDHSIFSPYFEDLENEYTLYSFDIFYHGKSHRPNRALSKREWEKHIGEFLKENQIDRFSLLSFSLGGRFCIALADFFPSQIDKIIMLAPDGIHKSLWFQLAVSKAGNLLFRYLMTTQGAFDRLLKLARIFRLASAALIKFSEQELGTDARRAQVYKTWTYFSPLQYSQHEKHEIFKKLQRPPHIVLGIRDSILPLEKMEAILSSFEHVEIHKIDAKHNQMIKLGKSLVSTLLKRD
ncbi:MAG: alpha/beta fold hydrolase [Cyclobacteriaceae bacterium]